MKIDEHNYTSIIPTAYVTAYPRTLTDIPYSKAIFDKLVEIRRNANEVELGENEKIVRLAPELEARYKLIDKLLGLTNVQQVLELAAGLSPRGLLMTQKDPSVRYIELELKEMAELKQKVISSITNLPKNLHVHPGNALNIEDLNKAIESFDISKRIAIVNEGLLRYLDFGEKELIAKNVHSILSRFGGVWITCDVTPKSFLKTQDTVTKPGMNKSLSKLSGKNFDKNMFSGETHVKEFFSKVGFSVEFHHFTEAEDELTSPSTLKISPAETRKLLGSGVVVVMKTAAS